MAQCALECVAIGSFHSPAWFNSTFFYTNVHFFSRSLKSHIYKIYFHIWNESKLISKKLMDFIYNPKLFITLNVIFNRYTCFHRHPCFLNQCKIVYWLVHSRVIIYVYSYIVASLLTAVIFFFTVYVNNFTIALFILSSWVI